MKPKNPARTQTTVTPAVILGGLAIFNGGMESLLKDLQHGDPSEQARAEDALRKVGVFGLPLMAETLCRSQDVAFGLRLLALVVSQGQAGMNSLAPYLASLMAHDRDTRIRDVVLRAIVDCGANRIAGETNQEQAADIKRAAARRQRQSTATSATKVGEANVSALPE